MSDLLLEPGDMESFGGGQPLPGDELAFNRAAPIVSVPRNANHARPGPPPSAEAHHQDNDGAASVSHLSHFSGETEQLARQLRPTGLNRGTAAVRQQVPSHLRHTAAKHPTPTAQEESESEIPGAYSIPNRAHGPYPAWHQRFLNRASRSNIDAASRNGGSVRTGGLRRSSVYASLFRRGGSIGGSETGRIDNQSTSVATSTPVESRLVDADGGAITARGDDSPSEMPLVAEVVPANGSPTTGDGVNAHCELDTSKTGNTVILGRFSKKDWMLILLAAGLVVVGAVVGVVIATTANNGKGGQTAQAETGEEATEVPDASPPIALGREEKLKESLLPFSSSSSVFEDSNSPQALALHWLAEVDEAQVLETDLDVAAGRYALACLYFATNGDEWLDDMKFLSESHVCDWNGVYIRDVRTDAIYNGFGMEEDGVLQVNVTQGVVCDENRIVTGIQIGK
jgi:hypothetical protein